MPLSHLCRRVFITLGVVCLVLTSLNCSRASETERAPGIGDIAFQNEAITVLRIHMAPHEKTPMHEIGSARLVIWLTDAHLKDIGPDGSATEYNRPAGSVDWITPHRHVGENLSDQDLDFLAIIPKAVSTSGAHQMSPP